jgi:signal transduction histidine kinase
MEPFSHSESVASLAVHLMTEAEIPRLSEQAESAVFDVVQESVANAIAHARADNIWIAVRCQEDVFDLSVRDDGRGFDVEALRAEYESRGRSVGLSAQDRVEAMQGTLSVQSAPGQGTTVRVVVPLSP